MVTDGFSNNPTEVEKVAIKWGDAVDEIFALGFAGVNMEGNYVFRYHYRFVKNKFVRTKMRPKE